MGERQKGLIGSRLFRALTVSKGDAAICTSTLTVFVGDLSGPGQAFRALQEVTATPPVPITSLGSSFQFTNSAGPHLMWPHYTS